ncbi:hypothetical protein WJX81_005736 [Elliptochloris bilobata]|uniref:Replication protein A subunit n=1 Tax=Elliptochloris bilobata TaxID=381761 RepID=A0AAW1R2Z1_9CHLO
MFIGNRHGAFLCLSAVESLTSLSEGKPKFSCGLSDGADSISAVLATQVNLRVGAGEIKQGTVLRLTEYTINLVNGAARPLVLDCEVVGHCDEPAAATPPAAGATEPPATARTPAPAPGKENKAVKAEPGTGAGGSGGVGTAALKTPAAVKRGPTPLAGVATPGPSPFTPGSARRAAQPIQALNPYNNGWTIKARVASKGQMRSFENKGAGGATTSLFSVELVDEQGTAIEATLWRELAERYFDVLEEGKVYWISRGKVKPANRNFTTVRNDYTINLDNGSEIEECTEADASRMQARLNYVSIATLPGYTGKRLLVDLLGVVTAVGPLGSVKRQRDGTELARRDITLADQSGKTVTVTLWGRSAEESGAELEALPHPLVSISQCRVTDYNGVSVSTITRSAIAINPEGEEADELRGWWDATGCTASLSHAGEGLASALKSGGAAPERSTLAALRKEKDALQGADAKPEYASISATIAAIDPAQSLYYQACPDNNRKVVAQGDGWFCEFDGKTYPAMVRRYVMQARFCDDSGEATLSVFDDQARMLLGMAADEVAPLKEAPDPKPYEAMLERVAWSEWLLRVQSRSQEYNGELRQRLSVASLKRIDFIEESRRMVALLTASSA